MAKKLEIEYKYLCENLNIHKLTKEFNVVSSSLLSQYYLEDGTRLRSSFDGDGISDPIYTITRKESTNDPRVFIEDEDVITKDQFNQFFLKDYLITSIYKNRVKVLYEGNVWEVDFYDVLNGLVTAELEIPSVDFVFKIPSFCTKDVTSDRKYKNINLSRN